MKIALFSDLHIYPHFSKTVFEDTALKFLMNLHDHCEREKIGTLWFLGDWFHLKNKIQVPSYIKSYDILQRFREGGYNLSFLIGNHDMPQADSADYSILLSFKDYGTVVPLYEWKDIGKTRFHFLSYTKQLPRFAMGEGKNVLITHLDINSFLMDGNYLCVDGFRMTDFTAFDAVFSGHFHKHQVLGNVVYVGSAFQTRYSERNDPKGFVVLDTDTLKWEFVPFTGAPVFKEVTLDDLETSEVKGNFVRIKTTSGTKGLSKIREKLMNAGAESVDFIFENDKEEEELQVLEGLASGSMKDLGEQYIAALLKGGSLPPEIKELIDAKQIDKDDFLRVFNEIEHAFLSGWKPREGE